MGRGRGTRRSVLIKNPGLREYILRDLATYTEYTLALQVLNPEGEGPATKVMVMTDEGGECCVSHDIRDVMISSPRVIIINFLCSSSPDLRGKWEKETDGPTKQ